MNRSSNPGSWTLLFRGWRGIALSDGALAVLAPHIPQIAGAIAGENGGGR